MNASLTLFVDDARSRFGRFITQSLAWAARAYRTSADLLARAASSFVARMDQFQQLAYERVFERRMAVRRVFLSNPRDVNSPYSKDGRILLAHWARLSRALAPHTIPTAELEKYNGMQTMLAMILADIYEDLPDFARAMADEERRRAEEIVPA